MPDPNASALRRKLHRDRASPFRISRALTFDQRHGYPGSRFETSEDRHSIQTPGLKVSLPLQ
jgi:hypothetical protein